MIKTLVLLILTANVKTAHRNDDYKVDDITNEKLSREDEMKLKEFLKSINENDLERAAVKDVGAYCQSLHSCYECVRSLWYPCNWCHSYGCTHKAESLCPYAAYNHDIPNNINNYVCPSINHQGHILIAAGVKTTLRVKLQSADPAIYEKEILCQLKFKEKLLHIKGLILNDMVYCYPLILDSRGVEETENGLFRLIWGGVEPFSNEIPVVVYRCDVMATDCESCRMLPSEYQCGWCEVMNSCVVKEKCVNDFVKWTLSRLTCQPYGKKLMYV